MAWACFILCFWLGAAGGGDGDGGDGDGDDGDDYVDTTTTTTTTAATGGGPEAQTCGYYTFAPASGDNGHANTPACQLYPREVSCVPRPRVTACYRVLPMQSQQSLFDSWSLTARS